MTDSNTKELREENEYLRKLILSLSATLLRRVAQEPQEVRHACDTRDAERLMCEAEECFRCARIPGIDAKIAAGLEAAGNTLMSKAVEIESSLQRAKRKDSSAKMRARDAIKVHASELLRLSYDASQDETVAEPIRRIAHALLQLAECEVGTEDVAGSLVP